MDNGKKMHWLEKDCHFVVPVGWAHCYGIGGVDVGKGPEIFLLLGSHVAGKWDRQELQTPHKMGKKKWHHAVGSYDGETMKIYIDGKVIAEEQKKFDFFGDNEADVRIGCAKAVPHLTFTDGSIDEAAVWQRALSDNEIKQAMTGNFLAVSPKDKVATTWADVKRRAVAPERPPAKSESPIKEYKMKTIRLFVFAILNVLILDVSVCLDFATAPATAKILFTSSRDGNYEVYMMNPDGSERKRSPRISQ